MANALIGGALQTRDWDNFRSLLSTPTLLQNVASAVSSCPMLNGMTILHAVVRCNPPLDIVVAMIRMCPALLSSKDYLGRTPLHIAAGSRTSTSLIKLLAYAHPAACDAIDKNGKTPLHYACDNSCSCVLFEDNHQNNESEMIPRRQPCHETVMVLLSYSLHAVTLEDDEGMSPLEHAIMSDASMQTVKLLQHATRKGMMKISNSPSSNSIATTGCLDQSEDEDVAAGLNTKSIKRRKVSIDG